MKNDKDSKLKIIIRSFKKEFNDSVGTSILNYIALFAFFSLIGLYGISYVTKLSILDILGKDSVLAVVIVALPTVIVWIFDINNKNILNKSERFKMYLKLQEALEEKYNILKKELKRVYKKKNVQIIFNQLDMIEKFISDLDNLKKYTDIESTFYQIDLFYFFDKVNDFENEKIDNKIESKGIDEKIGKVKGRIIKYLLANTPEDILKEKLYLFTEAGIFKNIDFRNLGDLSKLTFEGSPTFRFEYCKIDLNNFSGFLANNIKLIIFECEFYENNRYISFNDNKDYLIQNYNINFAEDEETSEKDKINNENTILSLNSIKNIADNKPGISKFKEKNLPTKKEKTESMDEGSQKNTEKYDVKNKEENKNIEDSEFVDKRSNISLTLNEVDYFSKEIDQENFSNGKIVKTVLDKQIKEDIKKKGMEYKDILIRYSKDYSERLELNGKIKWQSWHSIDLPVYDVDNVDNVDNVEYRLGSDSKIIIQSSYAFVTEKNKEFHILFFSESNFVSFLERKIEKNAYTIYKNAQLKYYVKFNFYFAELINEKF